MPSYGFKLFEFKVYEGQKRTPIDFADALGAPYITRARKMLKGAQTETFVGPVLDDAAGVAANNTGRTLLKVEGLRAGGNALFGRATAAKVGSIPFALGVPGVTNDLPLNDHGPGREASRFVMLAPPGGNATGLVVVEAVGRSCPNAAMQFALTQMSIRETVAAGPAADGTVQPHLRARLIPLSDPEHLEKVLKANNSAEIRLTKRGTGVGRGRESKEIEMFAAAITPDKVGLVGGVIKAWRQAKKNNDEVSAAAGAKALATIVGGDALADMDFDEGALTLDDNGRLKVVTPALAEEVFTYPLGKKMSDKEWFHAVAAQAGKSVQGQDVNVVWPAWNTLHAV